MKALLALLVVATVAYAEPTIQRADETLPNGLRVIVAPDSTVNSVVVYVRYRGGYAEDANTVVLDQLFTDAEHDARLDAIGGYAVSNFEAHHMDVFEVVPAGALELALWSEAKRMTMEIGDIEAAKTAALAAYESAGTYAAVDLAIDKLLWPSRGDRRGKAIEAVTLAQIRALAKARLSPSNATLVIAGRVDARAAKAMARRYFGSLPRGTRVTLARDGDPAKDRSDLVAGLESTSVIAIPVATQLALALVVEQRLIAEELDAEMHADEQLRVTADDHLAEGKVMGALLVASDDQTRAARSAAEVKLLLKLESLPYRARVLASGVDIDSLRRHIARVTTKDLHAFFESSRDSSVFITVRSK